MAQNDLPKFDVFGGYSYVRFSIAGGKDSGQVTSNLNGASAAVAFYGNRWIGFVGDFGMYKFSTLHADAARLSFSGSGTALSYLFGPRIRFGNERVTPFVQFLFGGAHHGDLHSTNATVCGGFPPCLLARGSNSFAMTTGGGVDFKIARHVALRGQAEYFMTRFKQGGHLAEGGGSAGTQNNARISVGVVFR